MTVVTFAGHREVYSYRIEEELQKEINDLLECDTEFIFYMGENGDFDRICCGVAKKK